MSESERDGRERKLGHYPQGTPGRRQGMHGIPPPVPEDTLVLVASKDRMIAVLRGEEITRFSVLVK